MLGRMGVSMVREPVRRIVGLGSGRCGTHSLAVLLWMQPGTYVTHERHPPLLWYDEPDPCRYLRDETHPVIGDVALYYLPHVERILAEFPATKFLCLKRDQEETVASFLRYLPAPLLHLAHATPAGHPRAYWDWSFPKIDRPTREERFREYWRLYYAEAGRLAGLYPDSFRVFHVSILNDALAQDDMLRFAGYSAPQTCIGIRICATVPRKISA
jgi:hypothetical protein